MSSQQKGNSKSGTNSARMRAHERQRQALELRKAGADYVAIARQIGYKQPTGAWHAVNSAMKRVIGDLAKDVLTLELERLDRMQLGLWEQATKGRVRAVDRVLRIMQRRARLLGLDAPTKVVNLPPGPEPLPDPAAAERLLEAAGAPDEAPIDVGIGRINGRVNGTLDH